MQIGVLSVWVGYASYVALAAIALWGSYCAVMAWMRVAQSRFQTEQQQDEFLDTLEKPLSMGDFNGASELCETNRRVIAQLGALAIKHRQIGLGRVKEMVGLRFKRDLMATLEFYMAWINMMIKAGPMVGLFGTVIGMMGAFDQISSAENVKPADLAANISVALITTAEGLAISIPLMICVASINLRIKRMEDLAGSGMNRFFEAFKNGLAAAQKRGGRA